MLLLTKLGPSHYCSALLVAGALALSPLRGGATTEDDGIVKLKSAYSMPETIKRMKKDIADRGIMFFDEIDQLAVDAGVTLLPSTLLVFGNPPLGTLFLTSDPDSGSTGRCGSWSTRMPRATCGLRISPGSRGVTASPTAGIQGRRELTRSLFSMPSSVEKSRKGI